MPETAVNEYYFPAAWENQIRAPGQIAPVKPEAVS